MRKTTNGQKPKPKLTDKEKSALDQYVANPKISKTEAVVRSNYDVTTRHSAGEIASRLFNKPAAQRYLESQAEQAANNIIAIANDKEVKAEVRLKANQDILDRTDGKATQKSINTSQTVKIIADFTGGAAGAPPPKVVVEPETPEAEPSPSSEPD
jgi:hypothetical protein